jgi:hypothetical protein
LSDYQDFVFKGGLLDKRDPVAEWKKVSLKQAELAKRLSRLKVIRIAGRDTDIKFKVDGRRWVKCDGQVNFPDGEIFTCPAEDFTSAPRGRRREKLNPFPPPVCWIKAASRRVWNIPAESRPISSLIGRTKQAAN